MRSIKTALFPIRRFPAASFYYFKEVSQWTIFQIANR
jgi:hypothetical protein